jgi:hypothetical protein
MATVYDQEQDVGTAADRLRAIAALVDQAPEFEDAIVACNIYRHKSEVAFHGLAKDELVALVRWLGGAKKFASDWSFYVVGKRDGVEVTGFARDRGEVCERVVVGKRTVPAAPEHEEEIVEWKCSPLLGEAGGES